MGLDQDGLQKAQTFYKRPFLESGFLNIPPAPFSPCNLVLNYGFTGFFFFFFTSLCSLNYMVSKFTLRKIGAHKCLISWFPNF